MTKWEKSNKLWIGVSERVTRIERDNLTTAENFPELRKNKEASKSQPSLGNKKTDTRHIIMKVKNNR